MNEKLISNRYRLISEIGSDEIAITYKAWDNSGGKPVIVNVLRQNYAKDVEFLAKFYQEARRVSSLHHPNIVSIYEIGQDGALHYIVTEYVEGRSLKELISDEAPLPIEQALEIAIKVCEAVGAAHKARLVHGGINPKSILLAMDGRVVVTDFGIASQAEPYLSPEQAVGENPSRQSDVYSIGALIYEMLAGRIPSREEREPLSQLNPHVPIWLELIVHKAMEEEPSARYRTAEQLGLLLTNYRNSEIKKPKLPEEAPPKPEEHGKGLDCLTLLLGVTALVAVLGLVMLWALVYKRYTLPLEFPTPAPAPIVTPHERERVIVPNLVGLEQEEAKKLLERLGLRLEIVGERHHDSIPALSVVEQTIPPGRIARKGDTVGVVISQGPSFLPVPSVVGLLFPEAEKRLRDIGFIVVKREEWSIEPNGTVLAQEPPPGSLIPKWSTVTLTVSIGRKLILEANLGGEVLLLACDLESDTIRPREALKLTLYWRALKKMNESYTVFIHLTRADGSIIAQIDSEPRGGAYPTSAWIVGEQVSDPYELIVPSDAPPGTYWIKVGMYIKATMQRLPVVDPGRANVEDNSIIVKEVMIIS
jgi:serine/threonine-protein kinase